MHVVFSIFTNKKNSTCEGKTIPKYYIKKIFSHRPRKPQTFAPPIHIDIKDHVRTTTVGVES